MSEKPLWRQFEIRILTESSMAGITCWQIPTEVRIITGGHNHIRMKSHPDFCCGILGFAAFFDAKSTNESTWSLKKYAFHEGKRHQFEKLEHAFDCGNIAGYLIYFIKEDVISWVSIGTIRDMAKTNQFTLSPSTPGVKTQDAAKPIRLQELMEKEITHRIRLVTAP